VAPKQGLTVEDRFEIFEQLQRHQRSIDNDGSRKSAQAYVELYWPEGKFTVHDLRHITFEGPEGLKRPYDYAHSVFPLHKWRHSVGLFAIDGDGDEATVEWRWIVSWKAKQAGTVSTGIYSHKFQKRNGQWKCLERISNVDPNWPAALFQPFVDREKETFRES
jgi:SnoaL-like domain